MRFDNDYTRNKSSLYSTCKSVKKKIRDYIKILSFLREKIKRALRYIYKIFEIIKYI